MRALPRVSRVCSGRVVHARGSHGRGVTPDARSARRKTSPPPHVVLFTRRATADQGRRVPLQPAARVLRPARITGHRLVRWRLRRSFRSSGRRRASWRPPRHSDRGLCVASPPAPPGGGRRRFGRLSNWSLGGIRRRNRHSAPESGTSAAVTTRIPRETSAGPLARRYGSNLLIRRPNRDTNV